MKCIMLIHVKIPTIFDNLTYTSMVNDSSLSLKEKSIFFSIQVFVKVVEISCSVDFKFYNQMGFNLNCPATYST